MRVSLLIWSTLNTHFLEFLRGTQKRVGGRIEVEQEPLCSGFRGGNLEGDIRIEGVGRNRESARLPFFVWKGLLQANNDLLAPNPECFGVFDDVFKQIGKIHCAAYVCTLV